MKKMILFCAAMLLCGNAFAELCDKSKLSSVRLYDDETVRPIQIGGTVIYDGVEYTFPESLGWVYGLVPTNTTMKHPLTDVSQIDATKLFIGEELHCPDRFRTYSSVCGPDSC